jgi:photosystem II stability/assembly factor-like uncharacterized protein
MKKILILICTILSFHFIAFSQLSQIADTSFLSGEVKSMLTVGTDIYAYGDAGGIFKSSDGGKNWAFMSSNMDTNTNSVKDLIFFKNKFYAFLKLRNGFSKILSSSDSCQSWQDASNVSGLPNNHYHVEGIGTANNLAFLYLYTHDQSGQMRDSSVIYYSSDAVNWSKGGVVGENVYLDKLYHVNKNKLYISIEKNGDDQLLYTSDGIHIHSIPTTGLSSNLDLYTFTVDRNNADIYVGNDGDPYRFDSVQNKWINIRGTGLNVNGSVDGITGDGNALFTYLIYMVGPNIVVETYRSVNKGGLWQAVTSSVGLPIPRIAVAVSDSNYVMGTQLNDIIYTYDTGYSWNVANSGYQNKVVGSLAEINDVLVTHNIVKGVIRSTDLGDTWSYCNTGLPQGMPGAYFPVETFTGGGKLFVTMEESPDAGQYDLYRSPNEGQSWNKITTVPPYKNMVYCGKNGNTFFMKFSHEKPSEDWWDTTGFYYRTNDAGISWTNVGSNFFNSSAMNLAKVYGFVGDGNTVYLLGHEKTFMPVIYYSTNNGNNWNKVSRLPHASIKTKESWSSRVNMPIAATDSKGNFLFVSTYMMNDYSWDSLYSMTTVGISPVNTSGLPAGIVITDLDYFDGYWQMSTTIGLFASKNGIDWKQANTSNYYLGMNAYQMVKIEDQLFLGTMGNGIWKFKNEKLYLQDTIDICDGDSATLTASGADSNFTWCCGYGNSRTIKIKPTTSASVTASITDLFGFTITDTVRITLRPKPTANFTIVDDRQCFADNKFNFLNTSIINTGTFNSFWDFGDGNMAYTQDEQHIYTVYDSSYTVKLLVQSAYGCKDSISKPIFFEKDPEAFISVAGDTEICDGDSVTLYANTGTNFSYQWYKNGNILNGETHPYLVVMSSGKYSFELTDNTSTCSAVSPEVEIIVHTTNLNPNFTASPRTPAWNSGAQQFDAVAFTNLTLNPGEFNFSWIFGDGNSSTDSDPFYHYKYNGTYSVSLTAEHKQTGCRDTFSRKDYILCSGGSANPCPITVEITYNGIPIICKNDSFLITATTTGNIEQYIWTHDGTVLVGADSSSIYARESGSYQVIVSDTNCSVVSYPFTLNNYPIVEPIIESEGSIRPCSNDSMRLFNTTYYSNYEWSTGQTGTSIYVKKSGDYYLTVTDIHGCQTTSEAFSVNASLMQKPEICLVTVDTLSGKNLIAWERPKSDVIEGYRIYKEGYMANVYNQIGYLPYDSVSVFEDTASVPLKYANRYKISLIDTCGTESAPSDHHKTIHLRANKGTGGENNLSWSHYEGFPFSTYKIYRGTSPKNLTLLDSVASNLNSYTDLNPPGTEFVFYQVNVVKKDTCYPEIFRAQTNRGPFSQSMSNIKDYYQGTEEYSLEVSQYTLHFDTNGGSFVFDIYTNLDSWTAVSDQSWLSVTADVPDKKLTATATKNETYDSRQAIITLSGTGITNVDVVVSQDGLVSLKDQAEQQLLVYPNPFKEYFYVYLPGTHGKQKSVSLFDMNGKQVFAQEYAGDELIKIDRNNMARGMYYVKVLMDKAYLQKVIAY